MAHFRTLLALAAAALATACRTSTQCDCLAPMAVVFGSVTGTTAPVTVDLRTADGDCTGASAPSEKLNAARPNDRGEYELSFYHQRAGPLCLVVTAQTLELPLVSVTRRVPVSLGAPSVVDQPRFRVDLTFTAP